VIVADHELLDVRRLTQQACVHKRRKYYLRNDVTSVNYCRHLNANVSGDA
jgi:hypothetical protein